MGSWLQNLFKHVAAPASSPASTSGTSPPVQKEEYRRVVARLRDLARTEASKRQTFFANYKKIVQEPAPPPAPAPKAPPPKPVPLYTCRAIVPFSIVKEKLEAIKRLKADAPNGRVVLPPGYAPDQSVRIVDDQGTQLNKLGILRTIVEVHPKLTNIRNNGVTVTGDKDTGGVAFTFKYPVVPCRVIGPFVANEGGLTRQVRASSRLERYTHGHQ